MLRYLLNFWLSSIVMMFAAGATIGDVGTGGGDGRSSADGDAGSAGGDGASFDDVGADGTGEDDAGTGSGDGSEADSGGDDTGADSDRSADSRSALDTKGFNPEDKKLLNLAQKAGPKEAQRVRQLLFAEKRLNKIVPGGVKAVAELVRSVEEYGGVEGVQQLQADLASHAEDAQMFERADPRWVEAGFEENPEAALKLFAHTLDFVADKHADQYNHLMAKVITNDLKSLPVHEIYGILSGLKDNPAAQQLAKQLAAYYNRRQELAEKVPERKVDDQAKALTDREAKVHEQEMGVRYKQVNAEVFPALKNDVTRNLRAEMKRDGLDIEKLAKDYPAEWRNMVNDIHKKVMGAAVKDARFIDNYTKRVAKGELKRAAELVNQKHADVIPDAVRAVRAEYGVFRGKKAVPGNGNRNSNRTQPGNAGNANQGWTRVSARPAQGAIDWSKTTQSMQLDGQYILKDGKKIQVVY